MNPIEEAGKVASGVLDVVKGQPLILALIIFNLVFAVLVFLGSKDFRANQLKLMQLMIEMTGQAQQLLAQCVVPPQERRGDLRLLMLPVPLPPPRPQEEPK